MAGEVAARALQPVGVRLALVGLGGAAGGLLRYAIDSQVPHAVVPWDIIAINVIGSFLLGLVAASAPRDAWWIPAVGPGFLGGFTTFSTVAALRWSADASLVDAAVVLGATLLAATGAAAMAMRMGDPRHVTQDETTWDESEGELP